MVISSLSNGKILYNLLNRNHFNRERSARKISMGLKITGAKDDNSGYQISEKMRVQLRGLMQVEQNVKNGRAMLATAEGGLQQATELLKKCREMAIRSANGIYTDSDRRIIDQEYQQCINQIDDIASMTNYNGIPLLDGSWCLGSSEGAVNDQIKNATITDQMVGGVHTITIISDGKYTIPAGFSGDIKVQSTNVQLTQETSAVLTNVNIQCDAGTNLFVKDLNIQTVNNTNAPGKSIIDFTGAGNTLVLQGTNTLKGSYEPLAGGVSDLIFAASLIHVGSMTELTINGDGNGALDMEKTYITDSSGDSGGAVLGGDSDEDAGKIVINSGNIRAVNGKWSNGAAIGSGASWTFGRPGGNITINGGNVTAMACDGAAIGSGAYSSGGNIVINGGHVEASILYTGDPDTDPNADTYFGAAIGGGNSGDGGNIVLTGGTVIASVPQLTDPLDQRPPIGKGSGGNAIGSLVYPPGTYQVTGSAVEVGRFFAAWTPPVITLPDLPKNQPTEAGNSIIQGGLEIQTGTRSNQVVKCYINAISSDVLGLGSSDLRTRSAATSLLGEPGLKGGLDTALERVLGEMTKVGAYQMRLEQTEATTVDAAENTMQAESTIRDADMAKEMVHYIRNDLLSQSSQAMIAQANQISRNVLTLIR